MIDWKSIRQGVRSGVRLFGADNWSGVHFVWCHFEKRNNWLKIGGQIIWYILGPVGILQNALSEKESSFGVKMLVFVYWGVGNTSNPEGTDTLLNLCLGGSRQFVQQYPDLSQRCHFDQIYTNVTLSIKRIGVASVLKPVCMFVCAKICFAAGLLCHYACPPTAVSLISIWLCKLVLTCSKALLWLFFFSPAI